MKIFSLVVILSLISSCSYFSKNKPQNLSDIPSWYLSPKQNDSATLYGIGEGYVLEEATKSALADMAARLSVSISSTSNLLREENNYDANEEMRQSIKQNIEEIDFSNFSVSNSKQIGEKIYVEVEVDRDQFVRLQKEKIEFLDNQVRNLQNDLPSQNIVKKRHSLLEIINLGKQSEILTRIIYSANGNQLKEKLRVISDAKSQLSKLNNKFEFYFDNKSDKKIFNVIKNAANKERISIAKYKKDGPYQIEIEVKSSKRSSKIYGTHITKVTIWFDNISGKKVIASNSIEVSGSSLISEKESYNAAISALKVKIEKEGILKVLGVL